MARWTNQTFGYVGELSERFRRSVGRIAQAIADHENAEYVLRRHVDEAFEALSRVGLNRVPFYKRPELEVGGGLGLCGLAGQLPDFVNGLFPGNDKSVLVSGIMSGMIVIGLGMAVHGWLRGSGKW